MKLSHQDAEIIEQAGQGGGIGTKQRSHFWDPGISGAEKTEGEFRRSAEGKSVVS